MSIRFRLLTEADVRAVLTTDELIETMSTALGQFSSGAVDQPMRPVISVKGDEGFFATMPAFVRSANTGAAAAAALGAKLVTVFVDNSDRGLPSHLASIVLLDPETGALLALMDGRYITEVRTAAVSAVSSRLLARRTAASLAIIGSGVQAHSHLEALRHVHQFRSVSVWSPNQSQRDAFAAAHGVTAVEHAGEAVVGADVIVLVTSSPTPVLENGWVKPGAHVICVGACRPAQREMDPALVARGRLFVDSRKAALVESGDVVLGISEGHFGPDHIVSELGEVVNGAAGRTSDMQVTIFKSLGLAVEDVTAAALAYSRAVERGMGQELSM
jgi:ornithine cyclodeaminase/alanine dehydrogenase-like protein (mu-crystallin family)